MKIDTREGIDRYVTNHTPTGSFLAAVLANDLEQSIARADAENLRDLAEIVRYVHNRVPYGAHGSREAVMEWTSQRVVTTE